MSQNMNNHSENDNYKLFSFLQFTSSLQTQFQKVFDLSPILSGQAINDLDLAGYIFLPARVGPSPLRDCLKLPKKSIPGGCKAV